MVTKVEGQSSSQHWIDTAEYEIHLDDIGIVRVLAIGFWDIDTVRRYFSDLVIIMHEARSRFGKALVLVDKRDAPVQSVEVAERLNAGCLLHYRPTDRLAVVTSTSLGKLQTRRVLPSDRSSAFVSISAAEHYLLTTC